MSREIDLWTDGRNEPLSRDARLLMRALSWYDGDDSLHPDAGSWIIWITEIPIRKLAWHAGLTVERATEAAKELVARDPQGVGIDRETVVLRH